MAYQDVMPAAMREQPIAPVAYSGATVAVHGLSIAYRNGVVLRDVSLEIERHRITAIIGPSGCGKSSFLMCLNRLIDLVPGAKVSGQITIDGQPVLSDDIDLMALRRKTGFVFQRPNPFPCSIRRNLELVLDEIGVRNKAERQRRMTECLQAVGLLPEIAGRLDSPALELSGGQQQRLCIARCLLTEPQILLLDEPCSALDPISTMTIETLLRELRQRITIVIVTHNMPQAHRIGDACIVFWHHPDGGHVIESGPVRQIFENPKHQTTRKYVSGQVG